MCVFVCVVSLEVYYSFQYFTSSHTMWHLLPYDILVVSLIETQGIHHYFQTQFPASVSKDSIALLHMMLITNTNFCFGSNAKEVIKELQEICKIAKEMRSIYFYKECDPMSCSSLWDVN